MAAQPKITPIPSNAPPFAHEFTKRMRSRKDIAKKPSVRQTTSIPQLLAARFFRNGKLTLEDFLEAAVFTTYPPDQDIAREVAEDILLGREKVERPRLSDKEKAKDASDVATKKQKDALRKVLDQIRREQELAACARVVHLVGLIDHLPIAQALRDGMAGIGDSNGHRLAMMVALKATIRNPNDLAPHRPLWISE